jgi:type IV pilus assembly protein PilC
MLEKCADFYEDEVDTAVSTLTSLIEPVTIVFLGGMIGTVLAAMYMPMFQLASIVK